VPLSCSLHNREAARPTAVLQICAPAAAQQSTTASTELSATEAAAAHCSKTDSQLTDENSCSGDAAAGSSSSSSLSTDAAAVAVSCAASYVCYIFHLAHMGEERVLPPSLAKLLCDPTILKVENSALRHHSYINYIHFM
jgi:hypothetical protein